MKKNQRQSWFKKLKSQKVIMLHKALMRIFEKCVHYFVAIFTAFISIFSPFFLFFLSK